MKQFPTAKVAQIKTITPRAKSLVADVNFVFMAGFTEQNNATATLPITSEAADRIIAEGLWNKLVTLETQKAVITSIEPFDEADFQKRFKRWVRPIITSLFVDGHGTPTSTELQQLVRGAFNITGAD